MEQYEALKLFLVSLRLALTLCCNFFEKIKNILIFDDMKKSFMVIKFLVLFVIITTYIVPLRYIFLFIRKFFILI